MSRVHFITGASSGLGAALAHAVLGRGERAVLTARRIDALQRIAAAHEGRALPLSLDVTDPDQRRHAVAQAIEQFGRIDVLANIAGQGSLGAAEEFSPEQLRAQMEINFFAAAELTRELLPIFRTQGSGTIVQLTSIGGSFSAGGFSAYCASKFALEGWSEALRDEVKPLGIRVIIVEPGAFRTEFAGDKNMRAASRIDAYRPVIEPVEAYLYDGSGHQPGDPARAAEVILSAIGSENPPLRLVLGADAFAAWDSKIASVRAELEAWREAGMATAFPGSEVKPVGGR
jgi:NAD(P)-dependent dehydrogenase (short-subunit alcohol dehydrogenase family)